MRVECGGRLGGEREEIKREVVTSGVHLILRLPTHACVYVIEDMCMYVPAWVFATTVCYYVHGSGGSASRNGEEIERDRSLWRRYSVYIFTLCA